MSASEPRLRRWGNAGPAQPQGAELTAPVYLHIGIPKSATTALQHSLWTARRRLALEGVLYPDLDGRVNHHHLALQLLGRQHSSWNPTGADDDQLQTLRAKCNRRGVRKVILSSEFLSEATFDEARLAVSALGTSVHVIITLRPLARVIPSSWQQGASTGRQKPFDQWLKAVLRQPEALNLLPLKSLRGDDGHNLITRWVELVGADRVTVLVPEPSDNTSVFRQFETVVGLRARCLKAQSSNESLSFLQSELTRRTGANLRGELLAADRSRFIQRGMVAGLKGGSGDRGARTSLPAWAAAGALSAASALVAQVEESGVRVIGDLADFKRAPVDASAPALEENPAVPLATVADACEGILHQWAEHAAQVPAALGPASALAARTIVTSPSVVEISAWPPRAVVGDDPHPGWIVQGAGVGLRREYQGAVLQGSTLQWEEFVADRMSSRDFNTMVPSHLLEAIHTAATGSPPRSARVANDHLTLWKAWRALGLDPATHVEPLLAPAQLALVRELNRRQGPWGPGSPTRTVLVVAMLHAAPGLPRSAHRPLEAPAAWRAEIEAVDRELEVALNTAGVAVSLTRIKRTPAKVSTIATMQIETAAWNLSSLIRESLTPAGAGSD